MEIIGIPFRNRPKAIALITARSLDDTVVHGHQIIERVPRDFIAQPIVECETARDLPLVLPEEKQIVPFVILERLTAREGPVDRGCVVGNIVDETLEIRIRQNPAGSRYEETLDLRPPEVGSELQRVSAANQREVVLDLIDIVESVLRQI